MGKATKEKLEYYIKAKPSAKETPGFFTDDGEFVRGPFYMAKLGKQIVALVESDGYRQDIGYYISRQHAIDGAAALQEKARQWLTAGNYA